MAIKAKFKDKYNSELVIDIEKDVLKKKVKVTKALKQYIAQQVIDKIVERTEKGKSLSGQKFKGYSKSYKESKQFKKYGKTSKVNLELKGDMLEGLDLIEDDGSVIKIGWKDDLNRAKATNHNFGVTLPKREFLGLQQKEVKEIAKVAEDVVETEESKATLTTIAELGVMPERKNPLDTLIASLFEESEP